MESRHKKSSTSPTALPHCSDISIQNVPRKTVSFQDSAKKFEKVLDNSVVFPYNSTR